MKLKSILIITLFLFCSITYGQLKDFDEVSVNDLLVEKDEVFEDASAIVLLRDIKLIYGRALYVKERIKIINRKGFEYATRQINFDEVKALKAHIYNLDNGKIIKTKLTSNDIFIEEKSENNTRTKLIFPNVKEGSIIEISYRVDYILMSRIYTQDFIPIRKIRIAVENPSIHELRFSQNPLSDVRLKVFTNSKNNLYVGDNIKPLKDERFVYNINNYRGKIYIEKFYIIRNKKVKSWGDVAVKFNYFHWFGGELEKSGSVFKKDLKEILQSKSDTLSMSKAIYFFVQKKMSWDNHYSRGCENLRKIYIDKKGDSGDINFLLISMLRKAGIKANPVLLSTKNNGYVYEPTISRFNNVIVALELDGVIYLLDASSENAGFGEIESNLMNGAGFIVYEDDSYRFVEMESNNKSRKTILVNSEINLENLSVSGDVKMRFDNNFAWEFRDDYIESEKQDLIDDIENKNNQLTISNVEITDLDNIGEPILLSYNFEKEDCIEEINEDIFFKPLLYFGISENKLNEDDRIYPINNGYPLLKKYVFNIKIPDGYQLKSLPKGKKIFLEDGIGSLKYNLKSSGNSIQVSLTFDISYSIIPANYYNALREMYAEYLNISESRIVLTKT